MPCFETYNIGLVFTKLQFKQRLNNVDKKVTLNNFGLVLLDLNTFVYVYCYVDC